MNKLTLTVLVILASCQVIVSQDSLGSDSDRTSLLLSALCLENGGQISQDCLNGLASRNVYRTIYAALASPGRLGGLASKSANNNGKLELPAKRGREDNSGFYSNW